MRIAALANAWLAVGLINKAMNRIIFIIVLSIGMTIQMNTQLLAEKNLEKAVLAGGCFWCVEAVYKALEGVRAVTSGSAGE